MHCIFPLLLMSKRAVLLGLQEISDMGFGGLFHLATPAHRARSARLAISFSFALFLFSSLAAAADIYSSTDANGVVHWSTQAWDTSYRKAMETAPPSSATRINSASPKAKSEPVNTARIQQRGRELYPLVDHIARRFAMDTSLIMALIEVESGFDTQAVSPKGARGLMQLMPSTAAAYGLHDVRDLHNPERNLDIGIQHLKSLLARHGGQWALALASYNAGQGAVAKSGQRIPGYAETMLYVPAVLAKAARPVTQNQPMSVSLNIAD